MNRTILFLAVCLPAFAMPNPLFACLCGAVVSVGGNKNTATLRAWSERDMIFVANALEVRSSDAEGTRMYVHFAVEASWRGPMPDTVTLAIRAHAPCAHYMAGSRYLVLADLGQSNNDILVSAPCDYGWGIEFPHTREMLAELGRPLWTPSPFGTRSIDTRATRIGAQPPAHGNLVRVTIGGLPDRREVTRVEIADQIATNLAWHSIPSFKLPEGLYQLRVEWSDGEISETYVSVRCEERAPGELCRAFRYFAGLRTPIEPGG